MARQLDTLYRQLDRAIAIGDHLGATLLRQRITKAIRAGAR